MRRAEASEPRQATAKRTCSRRRRVHSGSSRSGGGPTSESRPPPEHGDGAPPGAPRPARRADFEHAQDDEGPHQVELLLDRERPGVQQAATAGWTARSRSRRRGWSTSSRRRTRSRGRRRGCGGSPGPSGRTAMHDADDGDEQEEGGQEPSGAAGPEPAQPDRPAATPLLDQQGGDQEPGEHEEGVDAVEAAGHRVQTGVEGDDGEHRHGADAVEPADVAQRRAGPRCVSVRAHAASGPAAPGGVPSVPYWGNVHGGRASLPQAGRLPDDPAC